MTADLSSNVVEAYQQLCRQKVLSHDPAQAYLIEQLHVLQTSFKEEKQGWASLKQRVGGLFHKSNPSPAKRAGIYIFGGVGGGKSFLMNLFYERVSVSKRRLHFHAFMQDIHSRLKAEAMLDKVASPPLAQVAKKIAHEVKLLCLDELEIKDIADAMIIGRLFSSLLSHGVVLVFTSNRKPDELYKGGLHRERFLPFINLINQKLQVIEVANAFDYRRLSQTSHPRYYWPLNEATHHEIEQRFKTLCKSCPARSLELDVQGRKWLLKETAHQVVKIDFTDLAGKPLGAADYLKLVQEFQAIVLCNVPIFTPQLPNEKRRFITFIDVVYDHKVDLYISAAAPVDKLCAPGVEDFEFRRTASRLIEMQAWRSP